MSQAQVLTPGRRLAIGLALGAAIAAVALAAAGGLHAPDLALVAVQPPAIRIHLAAALFAFVIGAVLLLGPKGTLPHRTLGWTWAVAMGATAVSSLFIRELNQGAFSLIHALSGWTLVALPGAVYAARRHKVAQHRGGMVGIYLGGMVVAGGFAFLPGRLMWRLFLG